MSSTSRCIPLTTRPPELVENHKDFKHLNKRLISALIRDVPQVQEVANGAIRSHDTIYTGVSGIALMEYHLSAMKLPVPGDSFTTEHMLSAADKHLAKVVSRDPNYTARSSNKLSFLESYIGVATLVVARGLETKEQQIISNWTTAKYCLERAVDQVITEEETRKYRSRQGEKDNDDGCEILYGRAGMLYSLLYLRNAIIGKKASHIVPIAELASSDKISSLIDIIINRGREGAEIFASECGPDAMIPIPPMIWIWHGRRYLGGAHGIAGILQLLLSCPIFIIWKHLPDIFRTISWLVDLQDSSGNWPSKCPSPQEGFNAENPLVQWCHGAPGILIVLAKAIRLLHKQRDSDVDVDDFEDKLLSSLERGAKFVYKFGLLRKGVGLCHGVAGSVYALLAASDVLDSTSNRRFFAKAAHLAFLATMHSEMTSSKQMMLSDNPWSLYEGLAGSCCAWAEVLCRLNSKDARRSISGFPGYEDFSFSD